MSRIEEAMRVVMEFNDAFNRHDTTSMAQLLSEDSIFENTSPAPDGTRYTGKEAVMLFWQNFFRESPHAHIEIEEIFGMGKRCIMRWNYSWEDETGQKGHVRGVDVFQVQQGLITEKFSYVKG
ncbi:MAG: nuclear transport factor 2 family protein [Microbacteriaceae bacterium]|nr:nuclear transport factor 2 family protein [Microbacteriaceae bacterium]